MAIICPSVTPTTVDPHEYRQQLERVTGFAPRVQLDFMDGDFAPTRCMSVAQAWWPEGMTADIHLMYRRPAEQLETLASLRPSLVILHAEAEGDIGGLLLHLARFGVKKGVALLQYSQPADYSELIELADHVLLFSGTLGSFGGTADTSLLQKIPAIRAINPSVEIGWDGGVNQGTAGPLAAGGVQVLNVGGAIQHASDPAAAYATLVDSISATV